MLILGKHDKHLHPRHSEVFELEHTRGLYQAKSIIRLALLRRLLLLSRSALKI